MSRRELDAAIVRYVESHPDPLDRSAERVAMEVGIEPADLREIVHKSKKVRMRSTGVMRWHIVELKPAKYSKGVLVEDGGDDDVVAI